MQQQANPRVRNKKVTRKDKVPCTYCGQLGHLPKSCTQATQEQKALNYSYPQPKIKLKTESDIVTFKNRVQEWKEHCQKGSNIEPAFYQPFLCDLLEFLLFKCKELGEEKTLLVHRQDVRLAFVKKFTGNVDTFVFAETSSLNGYIVFSLHALNKLEDKSESGYDCEQLYIKKYCQKKENYIIWLLFHEFTHLFKGYNTNHHDEEFFEEVMSRIERYGLWLFD